MTYFRFFLAGLALLVSWNAASAQYFGKNKPRYEKFDFQVYESPTFEVYNYLEDKEPLKEFTTWAEQWYHLHQAIFQDTFEYRNPIILYSNHADFQQTNSIGGSIGVGTGGVTEALKNRVVLPLAMSDQQTHHVLGHELVHAFQYDLILKGDSTNLESLGNLPLWMVEGLAEYMSIGRNDAHTSMWMRDAVLNDDIPTIKDMDKVDKYFPYRWGQVFWSFITGLYGDEVIKPLFVNTAKYGFDEACQKVFQVKSKELSELWVNSIKKYYGDMLGDRKPDPVGRSLVSKDNGGRINIAPVLSPDGKYLIFLSEKNLFTTDLFLANAANGEIIRLVGSTARDGHIDEYDYIESAGTWSPDSKRFAFVGISKGDNVLIIKDVFTGKTLEEIFLKGVPAFQNPAWSPDGKSMVVTGLVNGRTDLYLVNLRSKKVERLTNDKYAELLPAWSDDGRYIAYSTDRLSHQRGRTDGKWVFNLARYDVDNRSNEDFDIFPGADNFNPIFDVDGNLVFLSDRDGYRNIYRYEPATGKVYQLTDLLTGASGITPYAPAITASRSERRNRFLYTYFYDGDYSIFSARPEDFLNREVDPSAVDMTAAQLPHQNRLASRIVDSQLEQLDTLPGAESLVFSEDKYRPKFRLDFASGGAGVGATNSFGGMAGGAGAVNLYFSDMLGDHQLFTSLTMNGQVVDFAGAVAYLNQKNRLGWGLSFSHFPNYYGTGDLFAGFDTLQANGLLIPVQHYKRLEMRNFSDQTGVFAQYPFSTVLRVEGGANYTFFYSRIDQVDTYLDLFNQFVYQQREKVDPATVNAPILKGQIMSAYVALVGDNSFFGIASPLKGYRYRIGVEKYYNGFGNRDYIGDVNLWSVTADYRHYFRVNPVTFALRATHQGFYGPNADRFVQQYLGYPWNVRGYFSGKSMDILSANGKDFSILLGSKMLLASAEVRLPLSGPERLSLIPSRTLLTEFSLFLDSGLAWDDWSEFRNSESGKWFPGTTAPIFSAGASLRINLFGALILEPYYAFPLMKNTKGVFGINFTPGW
ncbi:MAG: PD40 domain-containing protein [Lewinellaceae bacterium]|nr:PD40 domain-containing protein [Lewinellaceae bacterium]